MDRKRSQGDVSNLRELARNLKSEFSSCVTDFIEKAITSTVHREVEKVTKNSQKLVKA